MSKTRITVAGLLLAATAIGASPVAAHAAPDNSAVSSRAVTTAGFDGYLYMWTGIAKFGGLCRWAGNAADLGTCRNAGRSTLNNGYAGSYANVKLHYLMNSSGAAYCLKHGEYIEDMDDKTFNQGAVSEGRGKKLTNNVESIHWVNNC